MAFIWQKVIFKTNVFVFITLFCLHSLFLKKWTSFSDFSQKMPTSMKPTRDARVFLITTIIIITLTSRSSAIWYRKLMKTGLPNKVHWTVNGFGLLCIFAIHKKAHANSKPHTTKRQNEWVRMFSWRMFVLIRNLNQWIFFKLVVQYSRHRLVKKIKRSTVGHPK